MTIFQCCDQFAKVMTRSAGLSTGLLPWGQRMMLCSEATTIAISMTDKAQHLPNWPEDSGELAS